MSRITKPWIMTRDDVKKYLQITGTDYDTQIDTYLPIVTRDIELITNNNFILPLSGDLTNLSTTIGNISTLRLDVGHLLSSENFDNNAITDIDDDAATVTVTTAVGTTEEGAEIDANIFPIAKRPIAASMVLYNLKKYTENFDFNGPLKSERVGNYSWTGGDDGATLAGYPKWIVDGLNEITVPRFY
jgi:hypothetical protein